MRDQLRGKRIPIQRKTSLLCCVALALCSVVCQPILSQATSSQEKHMTHYALIFHATRMLTPEEREKSAIDIPIWVKQVIGMGITLDPRALGESETWFSTEGNTVVSHEEQMGRTPITFIVFFDSESREQAMEIARIHPALHYGTTVELREWTSGRRADANQ
jgi:hypothetical protein